MRGDTEILFTLKMTVPNELAMPLFEEFAMFSINEEKRLECHFIKTPTVEDGSKGMVVTVELTLTVPLYDKSRLIANIKRRCEQEKCAYVSDTLKP